jgi:hypothetical protein
MTTKSNLQPIENISDFKRDAQTNAMVSIDAGGLTAYKKRKNNATQLVNDINTLKGEMKDIKNMLSKLVGQLNE